MAINLDERYPGRANPKTLAYPQGSFKNRTSPSSNDGTYLEQDWANDWAAFFQSLMQEAGLSANGDVDEVGSSQYFEALIETVRGTSLPIYATTPPSNAGPIIYAIDRQQILLWQTIGAFTGYASADVGKFVWGTSISPRPGEEHLIGQTIDRSLPKYTALIAWAEVNGHMVASGSWTKGAFHFSSLGGNNVRLPDLRDMFIRATGTDADTANARAVGTRQSDAMQRIQGHADYRRAPSGFAGSFVSGVGVFGAQFAGGIMTSPAILNDGGDLPADRMDFDNARVARTSSETRSQNLALHPSICL